MHLQLHQYLPDNILNAVQCGFRKNHSTKFVALHLSDGIGRNTDVGLITGAVLIDLRKAFDLVN